MSKELIISCTVCHGVTTHYWQNDDHSAHMLCDNCYIELNQQANKEPDSDFARSFDEWRSGDVGYHQVTPQAMLERFLVQIFVEEE